MKKILFIIAMLWGVAQAQTTGYFRYDTIRMQKSGGNSELYIENATRGVTGGVLTNVGGGRTAFVTPASPVDPSDSIYGYFINSTFNAASIPSGLVSTGGTFVYVTTGLTISAGNNTLFDNRIETVDYTTSQNLSQTLVFTVVSKDSGMFIGRYPHSSAGDLGYAAVLKRTGASTARIELHGTVNYVDIGILAYSPDIAWTNGQTYRIYTTANTGAMSARVDRYDTLTNYIIETAALQYKIKWNGNSSLGEAYPNIGSPYFGSLSGTYRVRSFNEIHYDSRYTDGVIGLTSVSTRYSASSLKNVFYNLAFEGTGLKISINGGPGDRLIDFRANFNTVRLSHPQRFVMLEFSNDDRTAITTELPAAIDSINSLGTGAVPLVLQLFKDVDRDTTTMRICNQYGVQRINFGAISTTDDFVDLTTHPNDLGSYRIAMLIKSELPALIKTKGIERESLRGLQDVTLGLTPATGDLLKYNSAGQWENSAGVPLSVSQIGYGSVSNLMTGSANFTYSGSTVQVNGNITGTAQAKVLSLNETTTGGAVNLIHANSSQATARPTFLFSNNSSGDWVNNYALFGVNGSAFAGNNYLTNISGKTTDAGYTVLVNGGGEQTGMIIGTYPNVPLYLGTNNSARLTILGNGNVGVGTDVPGVALDVVGEQHITGNILVGNGSVEAGLYYNDAPQKIATFDINTTTYSYSNGSYIFNNTSHIYSNPVSINTGVDALYPLDVNGDAGISGKLGIGAAPDATGNLLVNDLAGTGSRPVIASSTGVLSAPVSDRSAKQNIRPLNNGLTTLMKLRPVSFEYKDAWKTYGQGAQIGFIAQDIKKVLPNSTFVTPSTGKMGYNEIDLVPLLVKAVQEQQKQIEELKDQIKRLQK